jgi:hypothetical protein
MKEYKPIEVGHNHKKHIRQQSKLYSRAQMSNAKGRSTGSRICRSFQLMKEYKLIEVTNKFERHIRQDSKFDSHIRMSKSKDSGRN